MNDCKNMYLINDVIVLIKAFKHFRELTEKKWCVSQVVLDSQSSKQRLCIKYIKKKKEEKTVPMLQEMKKVILLFSHCKTAKTYKIEIGNSFQLKTTFHPIKLLLSKKVVE